MGPRQGRLGPNIIIYYIWVQPALIGSHLGRRPTLCRPKADQWGSGGEAPEISDLFGVRVHGGSLWAPHFFFLWPWGPFRTLRARSGPWGPFVPLGPVQTPGARAGPWGPFRPLGPVQVHEGPIRAHLSPFGPFAPYWGILSPLALPQKKQSL